jgi:Fur family ferric uptake transcriptional regulator
VGIESNHKIYDILKSKKLSVTPCRVDILKLFQIHNSAIPSNKIEESIKRTYDRVTIYRTIKTFLECGILHSVPDSNGNRYALCRHEKCPDNKHLHEHIHFKCTKCDQTTCIDHILINDINLPNGYKGNSVQILIEGICSDCNEKGLE